jgi:hypothetical protein
MQDARDLKDESVAMRRSAAGQGMRTGLESALVRLTSRDFSHLATAILRLDALRPAPPLDRSATERAGRA